MTSLQSHFINLILRNRHLLKLRPTRETWDEKTSIPAFREECERGAAKTKLPEGTVVSPASIEGLPHGLSAEWIRPASAPESVTGQAVIFYTHGGGYVSGSCSDHRGFVAKFVQGSGVRALLYEYRLAPEHPYPAALEDTLTAYRWLLGQGAAPGRIVIAGESAGGGLCLATLLALRDKGIPLPAAAVALSPWTDLKLTGDSIRTRAHASIDPPGMSAICAKYYAGDNDPCLPYISPLYGELRGLPPILIFVGNDEMGRDDSIRFAQKAEAASVEVELHVGEGMVHCYPLFAPLFPEATLAMAEICSFIRRNDQRSISRQAPHSNQPFNPDCEV
jgi:monoterpene epsilon-lactone hydrolase